ncbi:VOC family protein [Actinoalloteichus hymeniacidonis]|uniref:Glyoxalase-like domain n=1 Tax=Actinoalloteichus hymeniacidonis TaxID=340345 RepID=A0AAC9MZL7_9PSEU|nr:VOC family protein [Actinoalloteichus hymeniacidonis]AOS64202.1 Glyoxalase-like domain [Actinoalloteichus hymeniacidonis]MBB5907730.1 catechol 2,3-dioxygenase-like lactoylglutathione lyase family enzyme [Actinoalloteichus hymeniacidonis]
MQVSSTTIAFTVDDLEASRDFFRDHFGYTVAMAADDFVSLTREDGAIDLVFHRTGLEVLPENLRYRRASGAIVAFVVEDLEAEQDRLRAEGVEITLPLRVEPWGERLFMVADPNGIPVELLDWAGGAEEQQAAQS